MRIQLGNSKTTSRTRRQKCLLIISHLCFAIAIALCIALFCISYLNVDIALYTQRLAIIALGLATGGIWIAMEQMTRTREDMRKSDEKLEKIIKALPNPKFEEKPEGKTAGE
ncbi:MAG: hypothetical protein IBX36_01400 [Dehalococcoidia bacterium]|nr:hypothetical protein [Dehalococcoidia bacterium]